MPIADRVLTNGIRLVTEPIDAAQSAAIGFWFYLGSRDESPREAGSTHFVEHLLFKGTARRSASDIARFFDRVGGYVNAFTERECVCLMCVVPPECTAEAMDVLADMTSSSVLDSREIELERTVILSEILSLHDDPDETGMETALALMYPEQPFSRPIAGTFDGISALDSEILRSKYESAFAGGPDLVTAAGVIDETLLSGVLGLFPSCVGRRPDTASPSWNAGYFARRSAYSQTQLYLSFPLFEPRTGEVWSRWALINAITGDMVSSRLFQSLREEKGLCYSVYSFFSFGRDAALWMASLSTPSERTMFAYRSLLDEIAKLTDKGISELEVADAASHLIGEMRLSSDDTEYRMKRLARQILLSGSAITIQESSRIITSIGHERLTETVRSMFVHDTMNVVVYGDKRNVKECGRIWK